MSVLAAFVLTTASLAIEPGVPEHPPAASFPTEGFTGGGWCDVDRDGRDDVVVARLEPTLDVWTRASPDPVPIALPVAGVSQQVEVTTEPDGERTIGIVTWTDVPTGDRDVLTWFRLAEGGVEELWAEEAVHRFVAVGDVDGDGRTDVALNGERIRLSQDGREVMLPLESRGRRLRGPLPVGDLDLDGYDDVLVTYEENVDDGEYYEAIRGHAALHVGGPDGLAAPDPATGSAGLDPLWELDSDQTPGSGAFVASAAVSPGDGTLVLAVVDEQISCAGKAWWMVLHDAGTTAPTIHQVEPVPSWDSCWGDPVLHVDRTFPEGGASIVWSTVRDNLALAWYPWDPIERTLDPSPVARWAPIDDVVYTARSGPLMIGTWSYDATRPSAIHVWDWEWDVDPGKPDPGAPTDPEDPVPTAPDGRSCGCATPSTSVLPGGAALAAMGIAGLAARRRCRRVAGVAS